MKKNTMKKMMELVNYSLKVDANSTSTFMAFQPKTPAKLEKFKSNK